LLSIASALSVVLLSAGYYIPAILCFAFVFYYLRAAAAVGVGCEGIIDLSGKDMAKGKADVMAPVSNPPLPLL
jgi:hypothetical protein